MKGIRERGKFSIPNASGARSCRPIGLDRTQLGLEREEGQIVDH